MNRIMKMISDLVPVAVLSVAITLSMMIGVYLGDSLHERYMNSRLQNAYYRLSEASRGDSLENYRDALHDFNNELMIAFPNGEKVNPTEYK